MNLRRSRAVLKFLSLVTVSSACSAACIIPDREIEVEDARFSNKFAVRLLEPTLLSNEATDAAEDECDKKPLSQNEECPQPGFPEETLPHFLDDKSTVRDYNFCACSRGEVDINALSQFTLYVEDQDEKPRSRVPKDFIYAALLLDLDPADPKPHNWVAYRDYLDPDEPLNLSENPLSPILRRNPHLRQLTLGGKVEGGENTIDLCNGAGGEPLDGRYHTLKVMVTDRPWFKHTSESGQELTQAGVPDLAAGATYDSITYVFHCDTIDSETETYKNCSKRCRDPNAGSF